MGEDLALEKCLICEMTFETNGELFMHTCAQIKVEKTDLEDEKQFQSSRKIIIQKQEEDLKYEIDPGDKSESDSDYSPQKKKSKKAKNSCKKVKKNCEKKEILKPKRKRPKVERNETEEYHQKQLDMALGGNLSNLELSEDFIVFILKQVDELCQNIKNGDPDIERTLEVNQNLSSAVSCYRNKLSLEKQIIIKSEKQEYYNDNIESFDDFDTKDDGDYEPKKPKKKKMGRPRSALCDKKMEIIKKSCGQHSLTSMSLMLNMDMMTIRYNMKKEGLTFDGTQVECELCELKMSNDSINQDLVFQFMKYDTDKDKFGCTVCEFWTLKRGSLYTHIKSVHKIEISANKNNSKFGDDFDCGNSGCKQLLGRLEGKKFWCKNCCDLDMMPKEKMPQKGNHDKSKPSHKLCQECGMNIHKKVFNRHLQNVHFGQKQKCPHCTQELSNEKSLKTHIKNIHEKIPCVQCGKMVGPPKMSIHMKTHLPIEEQRRFKCEICAKGFLSNQHLNDHMNVHTGKKPHKCKFCSTSFASLGTRNMHQKGHLGIHRNSSKK